MELGSPISVIVGCLFVGGYDLWFQIFFMFTPSPLVVEMIQFDSYFSNGLKPPASCGHSPLTIIPWLGKPLTSQEA